MKIDSIYLTSEKGLTTTSANFLANLAKEILKESEKELESLSFVTTKVELINGEKKTLEIGRPTTNGINALIQKIGKMHSFIAWMREAIKVKDALISRVDRYSLNDYIEDNNLELPKRPEEFVVTPETIISEMTIKERQRYLMLEAFASAYGQYIHPEGEISEARNTLLERVNKPTKLMGNGRDTLIYTYEPSLPKGEVENLFLELQAIQRDYEKQLNAIKFQIKEEVNKRNMQNVLKYRNQFEEYNKQMEALRIACNEYTLKLKEQISSLKIIVPNDLVDTFEYLNSLGSISR